MRIGFDVSQTGQGKAGCGYVADSLIQALTEADDENEYVLYPAFGTGFWDPDHTRTTRRISRANVSRGPEDLAHDECISLWQQTGAALESRIGRPDIVHSNNYFCPVGLEHSRLVYTLYDLVALDHPEFITEANRLVCSEGLLKASVWADMIIAISDATRQGFLTLFPHYPASRIHTVHLASRFAGVTVGAAPDEGLTAHGFWLAVATREPRKNLDRLLSAYASIVRRHQEERPLVLAGGSGWMADDLESAADALGIGERLHVLGYVADDVLAWLYANCFCFVYPALVEGFGLPVLEAMSLGAPVITSDRSSLAEVAADAALTTNPEDEDALAAAMLRVAADDDLRIRLQEMGRRRADAFSWSTTACAVRKVYDEAVRRPPIVDDLPI